MKSPKEVALDQKILERCPGALRPLAETLVADPEIQALQEYANVVSIRRLKYNDHGPVHMRQVLLNALTMADLLRDAGVALSLESEEAGSFEDSKAAVMCASFLHDIGMTMGRQHHENNSALLALPILDRLLGVYTGDDLRKRVMIRCLALEGIVGHMAVQRIHSLEAGLVLVADGCDMEKGRARIPMLIAHEPRIGDMHQYSASAIEKVRIDRGENRPIRIMVEMSESVGFFQIEEVLLQKVNMSPVKPHVELYARVRDGEPKRYLM